MKKKINLMEVLKTGSFGTVQIGDSQSEIIDKLGIPDEIIDFGGTLDIVYGRYEFFYTENLGLYAFQNDQGEPKKFEYENKTIKVFPDFFLESGSITYAQVKILLVQKRISYSEIEINRNPVLFLKSGVYLDFADPYSSGYNIDTKHLKDFLLLGFRYFPLNHKRNG